MVAFTLMSLALLAKAALAAECNFHPSCASDTDHRLDPFNAVWNGTVVYATQTDGVEASSCDGAGVRKHFALTIGPMTSPQDSKWTRTSYDKNQFYLTLARDGTPEQDDDRLGIVLYSSRDVQGTAGKSPEGTQGWELNAEKSGDGYNITGKLIKSYPFSRTPLESCRLRGPPQNMGLDANWRISGFISPKSAKLSVNRDPVSVRGVNSTYSYTFEGTWDPKTPALDTSGSFPTVQGVSKYWPTFAKSSSASATTRGGLLALTVLVITVVFW